MAETICTPEGQSAVLVTRRFAAIPAAVYEAHTQAESLRQWVLGPEGWAMTVCESEAVPGGRIHFEWMHEAEGSPDLTGLGSTGLGSTGLRLTGEYLEVEPGVRTVHRERMHMPDPSPDTLVETSFAADGEGTLLRMRMTYPDAALRDQMLNEGMSEGMSASYARLDTLLSKGR
jgi:uncharacterized protein YndB with AHSA1/START domain